MWDRLALKSVRKRCFPSVFHIGKRLDDFSENIQLGKESSTQVRSLLRGPTPAHERNAECKLGPRQRAGGGRAQTSPSEDDIRG